VAIPDSITSIGDFAFYECSGLTSVTIPNSITSIGSEAFSYCSRLMSLTIPNVVTRIGNLAFYQCDSLKSLIFKGKTLEEVKAMDNYPFGIEDETVIECED